MGSCLGVRRPDLVHLGSLLSTIEQPELAKEEIFASQLNKYAPFHLGISHELGCLHSVVDEIQV